MLCKTRSRTVQTVTHLFNTSRCAQSEVFDVGVKDIVESVLDGYNGSIIASGQTGMTMVQPLDPPPFPYTYPVDKQV